MSSRKTAVLLVAPTFGDVGGIETFLFRLARMIDQAEDLEVTLCLKRTTTFELRGSLTEALERESFPVSFVDRASRGLFEAIRAADVVHSQTPSIDVGVFATLLRKPHVMSFHGAREHAPRLRQWIAALLPNRRLYGSDYIWRTWEPRRRRRTSEKLPVLSDLPAGVVEPRQRRGFAFVGRWVPRKGLDTLVEAYDRAEIDREAWPLVLVGDGPLRPSVEREVRLRGIDAVEMPGHLGGEARDAVIRRAKWMVVPSDTSEALGLTAIEARHAGVPCIVTRDGGLPDAAGALSPSCEPGNAAQLARLLELAAAMDEPTYEWLARATRDDLLAELRPMELYLDLYRELGSPAR